MNPFAIMMFIFGVMILFFGFSYYRGNKTLLPMTYHGPETKDYLKYLGKVTMFVGLVPILTGIVACIPGIGEGIIPVIVLILGVIIALVVAIKIFHTNSDY